MISACIGREVSLIKECVFLTVSCKNIKFNALIDTGSMISLISCKIFNSIQYRSNLSEAFGLTASSVSGQTLELLGKTNLTFESAKTQFNVDTYVSEIHGLDCLLGMNFLRKYKAQLDFSGRSDKLVTSAGAFNLNTIKVSKK